jgi:acetolactate synthase I/II/III large subunit
MLALRMRQKTTVKTTVKTAVKTAVKRTVRIEVSKQTLEPHRPAAPRKVADAIAATLYHYGVRHAFGIPGNDVLELIRACTDVGIQFTLAKSEPSAAFMADAVTHITGKPAVCIFALGPGIANGISGMAGALMERAPVIFLGGEMAANRRSIYNHQAFDHVAATTPVVKYAAELNPERAGQQTARALDIALTHPRGPVFLNCPADATRSTTSEPPIAGPARHIAATIVPHEANRLRKIIGDAKRPVALVGLGALNGDGPARSRAFIEHWHMPMFATYKAKGVLPEDHPLCLGAVALSPVMDDLSLSIIRDADVVVLIGFDPIELRDAWLDAFGPQQTVIAIDNAPQTHGIFHVDTDIVGDIPEVLQQLMTHEPRSQLWSSERLSAHKQACAAVVRPRDPDGRISPAALFHTVSRKITDETRLTVDVGAHRILANHVIQCRQPGQLLQSNGLGCMGYAIPATIGVRVAAHDRPVIALVGDGSALMSLGELAVIADVSGPTIIIVLNDDDLALIDLKQSKMNMRREAVRFTSPHFADLARGFGITASRVSSIADFEIALDQALAAKHPVLIEAMCDPAEYWDQM